MEGDKDGAEKQERTHHKKEGETEKREDRIASSGK
jgi:hypothetical protein